MDANQIPNRIGSSPPNATPMSREESRGPLRGRVPVPVGVYRVMDAQKDTYNITRMTRLSGVSRSGYCAWAAREAAGSSPARQRRAEVTAKIADFHGASDGVVGSLRITADLRAGRQVVSRKPVVKLMRGLDQRHHLPEHQPGLVVPVRGPGGAHGG